MLEVTQMETRFHSSRYFFRFERSFSEDLSDKCQKSYFNVRLLYIIIQKENIKTDVIEKNQS